MIGSNIFVFHTGMRPGFPVVEIKEGERFYYYEQVTGKKWTMRELNSGCGERVEYKPGIADLLYCSYCDEWFQPRQFEKDI